MFWRNITFLVLILRCSGHEFIVGDDSTYRYRGAEAEGGRTLNLPWTTLSTAQSGVLLVPKYNLPNNTRIDINTCFLRNAFLWLDEPTQKGQCLISPKIPTTEERDYVIEQFKVNTEWVVKICDDLNSFVTLIKVCVSQLPPSALSDLTLRSVVELVYLWPESYLCGKQSMLDILTPLQIDIEVRRCVTVHSICPVQLGPHELYEGIYNNNYLTLSACDCDYAFYTCLSALDTFSSKLLLYLYFNQFQAQDRCVILMTGKRNTLKIVSNPKTIETYPYPFYDTVEDMCKYAVTLRKAQDVTFEIDSLHGRYTLLTEGVEGSGFRTIHSEGHGRQSDEVYKTSSRKYEENFAVGNVILKEYPKPKRYRYTEEL